MIGRAVLALIGSPFKSPLRAWASRVRCRRRRALGGLGQRRLAHESLERRQLLATDLTALSVFDINDDIPVVGDDQAVLGDLIFSAAGKVVFPGVTAAGGAEIQILDSETLVPVTLEVNPGLADANPQHVTTIGDNVYFSAYDATVGSELRWFDASEDLPTIRTIDVNPGPASSDAGEFGGFVSIGDRLFFTATDTASGTELRWIDTTEQIPSVNTIDIWSGSGDSDAGRTGGFTAVGETLFFSAKDGAHGVELRWIDTGDASLFVNVVDINEGIGGSDAGLDGGFTLVNDRLFFSATDALGFEPRWMDVTQTLPTVNTVEINQNGSSTPKGFQAVGDKVYFWADDDALHGNELRWIDTASVPTTIKTLDILTGPRDSRVGKFGGLQSVGDKLFFSADDGERGLELQWIDTTLDVPALHTMDIASGTSFSNAGEYGGFRAVGDRLFFNADDRTTGRELRWIDTTADEMLVSTIDIRSGPDDSFAGRFGGFRSVGDKLFFTSTDSESGYRLRWVDAMSPAPSVAAVDAYRGSANSLSGGFAAADGFAVAGDKLYFSAFDSLSGTELRWIDTGATSPAAASPEAMEVQTFDVFAGVTSSSPTRFTTVGDKVFFAASDEEFGTELRWIDASDETPTLNTIDVWDGSGGSLAGEYGGLFLVGDKLFFTASDRENGAELRWIDTTVAEPELHTLDIESGSSGSRAGEDGGFVAVGDKLFFTADDNVHGRELRWIDTTLATPTLHTLDIELGPGDSEAGGHGGFMVVGNRLFFTAASRSFGYEPRWLDATLDEPIVNTIDVATGAAGSRAGRFGGFALVNDKLYFTADDATSGSELRWVDATGEAPSFTTIEVNVAGGSMAGEDGGFAVVGDKLFFNANDNEFGKELRWIDTSSESPVIHTVDIKVGSESSRAGVNGFALVGDKLFFDADDGVSGSELSWIDTTVLVPDVNTIDVWSGADGARGEDAGGFVVLNERLFFAADTFGFGNELFALDLSEVTEILPGDLNVDGVVDGRDVDLVCSAIGAPLDVALDFDGNETNDYLDVEAFIRNVIGTEIGDANLDGAIDAADLNQVGLHWQGSGGWAAGDFNCDTMVNAADLNSVGLKWQFAAGPVAAAAAASDSAASDFAVANRVAAGRATVKPVVTAAASRTPRAPLSVVSSHGTVTVDFSESIHTVAGEGPASHADVVEPFRHASRRSCLVGTLRRGRVGPVEATGENANANAKDIPDSLSTPTDLYFSQF